MDAWLTTDAVLYKSIIQLGLMCQHQCGMLQDQDSLVRGRAASCLAIIGKKPNGVRKILSSGALITLLDLLQDADVTVR